MPNTVPEIQVACAVIWRDGRILLSKRFANQHQGDRWEFPGGKCEPGEPPELALARELNEELGLSIQAPIPICQIPWNYGDKRVRLWVYEVHAFSGTPQGLEGQPIQWWEPAALSELTFPDANRAIVRSIGLPRIVRIFDAEIHNDPMAWIEASQQSSILYFRGMPPSVLLEKALERAVEHGHLAVLAPDQWPCHRPGLGVHLRRSDEVQTHLARLSSLSDPWPIIGGIRSYDDWLARQAWPADLWLISPVKQTRSHPSAEPLGWSGFSALAANVGTPAVALGGMTGDDLDSALAAFGYGVAGIRGL